VLHCISPTGNTLLPSSLCKEHKPDKLQEHDSYRTPPTCSRMILIRILEKLLSTQEFKIQQEGTTNYKQTETLN